MVRQLRQRRTTASACVEVVHGGHTPFKYAWPNAGAERETSILQFRPPPPPQQTARATPPFHTTRPVWRCDTRARPPPRGCPGAAPPPRQRLVAKHRVGRGGTGLWGGAAGRVIGGREGRGARRQGWQPRRQVASQCDPRHEANPPAHWPPWPWLQRTHGDGRRRAARPSLLRSGGGVDWRSGAYHVCRSPRGGPALVSSGRLWGATGRGQS